MRRPGPVGRARTPVAPVASVASVAWVVWVASVMWRVGTIVRDDVVARREHAVPCSP